MAAEKKPRAVVAKIANQIVRELFVNGATRLALKRAIRGRTWDINSEVYLGGWCKAAAREHILTVLLRWLPDPPKPTKRGKR